LKGNVITTGSSEKAYHIPAFTTNCDVKSTFEIMPANMSEDFYKVIMGRNIIMNLGLVTDLKNGKLFWDELELNLECTGPKSDELYEHSSSLVSAIESRIVKILDAGYERVQCPIQHADQV
jgi:hypothetical protein